MPQLHWIGTPGTHTQREHRDAGSGDPFSDASAVAGNNDHSLNPVRREQPDEPGQLHFGPADVQTGNDVRDADRTFRQLANGH
jgi:hypothetical protein